MFQWLGDLKYGARLLLGEPLITTAVLLSLGLGIGGTCATFSYVGSLFLRPVPGVGESDRVLALYTEIKKQPPFLPLSFPNFQDIRQARTSFGELAASQPIQVNLAGEGRAEQIPGQLVTASYFGVLGVRPILGRFFLREEDGGGQARPVVVLSEALWRGRFGAEASIVGRVISLNQRPFTVVGVAGGSFRGVSLLAHDDLWVPMALYPELSPAAEMMPHRGDQTVQVLGRVRSDRSVRQAVAEARSLGRRLEAAYPEANRDQSIVPIALAEAQIHPNGRSSLLRGSVLLIAISGGLLLVTFSNVSSLLLARAIRRGPELALRIALGASRARLARQLLAEGVLVTVLAIPASTVVAYLGAGLLWTFRPSMLTAGQMAPALHGEVLGLLLLMSGVCVAVVVLAPFLQMRRLSPAAALGGRPLAGGGSRRATSSQSLLVAGEVALSSVAIALAIFFLVRLHELRRVDPGFDSPHLLALTFDVRPLHLDPGGARSLEERLRERIGRIPGVRSVAFAENRLLDGFQILRSVAVPARDGGPVLVGSGLVDPGYFSTAGIPLLRGRCFSATDREGSAPVAIVSEAVARKLWSGTEAVGGRLLVDAEKAPVEVVGVVRDIRLTGVGEPARPFLYFPFQQRESTRMTLHVRTAGDPASLLAAVEQEANAEERDLPFEVRTLPTLIEQSLSSERASAYLLTTLSLLALIVATIGVYGVVAYSIARRRFEIGLRIALGAKRGSLVHLLFREGTLVVLGGVALGAIGAFFLTRWAANLLTIAPPSGVSLLVSGLLLIAVSGFAAVPPMARALRIEPSIALRES